MTASSSVESLCIDGPVVQACVRVPTTVCCAPSSLRLAVEEGSRGGGIKGGTSTTPSAPLRCSLLGMPWERGWWGLPDRLPRSLPASRLTPPGRLG